MQKLVFRNANGIELDLTTDPFGITEWEGFSANDLNIQSQQVPFQDGSVFLDALLGQRELSVTVAMQDNNNLETRYRLRREMISKLNPKLGEGVLIYTNDYLSKQIHVIPQLPVFENHNSNDSGTPKVSCSFTACNPYWEDLEDTVVNLSLSQVAVIENQGDVPAQVEIEMYGNAVNPKITNMTNGKKIEYQNQLDMPLYINTGIGVKEVSTETVSFEYNQFKGYIWGVYYVEEQNIFIALSEDCLLYSVDGNNWENHMFGFGVFCLKMIYVPALEKYIICCNDGKVLLSDDLYNWELVSVVNGNVSFYDICYSEELNLIVAVGCFQTSSNIYIMIYTSQDGVTWTRQTDGVPTTNGSILYGVIYSAEKDLFVAVGSGGTILTSSDGVTWTSQTSGTSNSLNDVVYISSLEMFIVAGSSGVILTSPDGTTWTSRTSGVTDVLRVILENNSVIKIAGQGVILTSTDGTTWTKENVTEIEYAPQGFCYSDVAKKYIITGTYGMIVSSEDGQEWERQNIGEYYIMMGIVYAKGLYVAVCQNGLIATSPNKKDWTTRTSGVTSNINDIVYSAENDLFVAVCSDGKVLKSVDGINWEIATTLRGTLIKVKWIAEKNYFVIINSASTNSAIYTANENFDEIYNYNAPSVVSDIAYSPKIDSFVIFYLGTSFPHSSSNSFGIGKTNDFVNYTNKANPYLYDPFAYIREAQFTSVIYSKEQDLFVAVGKVWTADTPNCVPAVISQDGETWTKAESPILVLEDARKIIYSTTFGKFVVTGENGLVAMSSDGLNWETFNSGVATYLTDIIDQDLTLVFVGDSSIVLSSVVSAVENKIQYLSEDSNIGFNLSIGENKIRLNKSSGSFLAKLRYRQKYIGV